MSVRDAKPGDLYADPHGNVWRVIGIWQEPTVKMMQIDDPAGQEHTFRPHQHGGVSGQMWEGFKRILTAQDRCSVADITMGR